MVPVQPDGGAKIIAIRPDVKIPDRLETPRAVVLATPFAVALMAEVDFQLADRNDEGGEEAAAIFKGAQRLRDDTQKGLSFETRRALRLLATEAIDGETKN